MMDEFTTGVAVAAAVAAGLLALDGLATAVHGADRVRHSAAGHALEKVIGEMHNGDLNPEDFDALAAGYYEGLRKDAGPTGLPAERDDVQFRDDFLRYELRPNVKREYPAGMRITNSLGMANPEYGYEKPPHTRRIAILGDSISLGPYGNSYDALLEKRLNQDCRTPGIDSFQVLNFAVYGYSSLQMMDVALEKAPRFHPDVYVVAMTHLEVMPKAGWRTHVGRLVLAGTDLKYPYLRDVVARAGVRPTDHLPTIRVKLAPSFLETTRWALEQIRNRAAAEGARVVIALVPAPITPDAIASDFSRLHRAVDGLGAPVVDLRDTFRQKELPDFQVVPKVDIHPNVRGHELLFETLWAALRADPQAWAAVSGAGAAPEPSKTAAASR